MVHALVVIALVSTSGVLTQEIQRKEEDQRAPLRSATWLSGAQERRASAGRYRFERLTAPARTIVRDSDGSIVAAFTDGARTAVLTGPSRTIAGQCIARAPITTDSWVRLLPRTWTRHSEKSPWFQGWFSKHLGDTRADVIGAALEYANKPSAQQPRVAWPWPGVDRPGAGALCFSPAWSAVAKIPRPRPRHSDFNDFLGVSWRFADGVVRQSASPGPRALDSAGLVRLVLGYRNRYPLNSTDRSSGAALPRTADAMAARGPGVRILPPKPARDAGPARPSAGQAFIGKMQPGDLAFFKSDRKNGRRSGSGVGCVAIYLGLDIEGNPRFLSSRAETGPFLGGLSHAEGIRFRGRPLRAVVRL
ncbi:hypothetical protein [Wenjunlia tyrosinilytica]|uniref:hypothetical protein n=1 Tax=Wenjunlia tyrosinilytica TaxID=1544741 RepID=UPI001664AEF4|nr:hypothetical protein [Wenjunlia tyrosinilytica]